MLRETLVLGLLLGVGSGFIVLIALAQVHWFFRAALPLAIAWFLLPTRAYPAVTYFLLTAGETLAVLAFARCGHRPRDSQSPAIRASTFSLRSLLIVMALLAALCAICVVVMKGNELIASQFWSSIASSSVILAAAWCSLTRRQLVVRLAVMSGVLIVSTAIWDYAGWFELFDTYLEPNPNGGNSRIKPTLPLPMFGMMLASCTVVMVKAFHLRIEQPLWQARVARCIAAPVIVVALMFGGYLYYRLARPLPIPSTDQPIPNGHMFFMRAGESLRSLRIPEQGIDTPAAIESFVSNHREALSLVRKGLELDCKTAIVCQEDSREHYISRDEWDRLSDSRQVARALQAEAFVHALSEDYDQAAQSCVDCIRFAHETSRGGGDVHFLAESWIERVGIGELQRLIPQLDPSTCRAAAVQLLHVDAKRERIAELMQRDLLWAQVVWGWEYRVELAMADLFDGPYWTILPLQRLEQRNDTIRRLLIVELALRAFLLEHHAPPRELNDLVPEYLPRLPDDPYGHAPLRYRNEANGAIVYSIGPDLDDDWGRSLGRTEFVPAGWTDSLPVANGDVVLGSVVDFAK